MHVLLSWRESYRLHRFTFVAVANKSPALLWSFVLVVNSVRMVHTCNNIPTNHFDEPILFNWLQHNYWPRENVKLVVIRINSTFWGKCLLSFNETLRRRNIRFKHGFGFSCQWSLRRRMRQLISTWKHSSKYLCITSFFTNIHKIYKHYNIVLLLQQVELSRSLACVICIYSLF